MGLQQKIKLYSILFLLAFQISLLGQDKNTIENQETVKDFLYYIEQLEAKTDYRFYFDKEFVKTVDISSVTVENLEASLSATLKSAGLQVYFDGTDAYIFKGMPVISFLPDYQKSQSSSRITTQSTSSITETEKQYKEGLAVADRTVLTIGNKTKMVKGKTCIVNGKIVDETTGEPLIGATLFIQELGEGSATDIDGHFKLAVVPGKYEVKINHMSMKEQEYILQVYTSGSIDIEMTKELIEINEVVVSSARNDNVKGMQMGYEKISAKSMKEIPAIMGEKDILKIAQMLPGVENMGEGTSGFNVRGSAADQNMFYINKIPVYNTSHLLGFFTAFSPDIVQDFTLYKSNIPARYGGRLASVFDVSTRQGNKRQFFAQGGISPVTAHVSAEGPVVKEKVSAVISYRSTYSDWILNRIPDEDIQNSHASFYDFSLGFNAEINDKNLVKVFGYRSQDEFSYSDQNDYNYMNNGFSTSWKHLFSSSLTGDFSYVYANYSFSNTDKTNESSAYTQDYGIDQHDIKADFNLVTEGNHRIEAGFSSSLYNINRGSIEPYGESGYQAAELGMDNGLESAIYISDEFKILSRLSVSLGLRFSVFNKLGGTDVYSYYGDVKTEENVSDIEYYENTEIVKTYVGPEPRVALNYGLTNSTSIKGSYSRTKQYIFMLSNTMAISPNDQWKLADANITPPVADQVSVGVYQNVTQKGIEASVEAYYKKLNNIVEYRDGADFVSPGPIEWQILQGEQTTKGIEFMLRKKSGKLTGWLSYTLSNSTVLVDSDEYENKINNGNPYPSNYNRPHSFNLVSTYKFNRRLSISNNFVYTSGRPVTLAEGYYYQNDQWLPYFGERNSDNLPAYIRWDVSINLEGNLINKKLGHSFWMLNVYNLTGRDNVYSVFPVSEVNDLTYWQMSIIDQQILTLSWNFKFGNYLSE